MSNRIERANAQIQKALGIIISQHMNDPRINEFVGVGEVKVAPDFRFCRVKIILTNGDYSKEKEVMSVLKKSEGFIKNKLASMLDMPHIPHLEFVFDRNMLNAIRVEEILSGLNIPKLEEESDDDNQPN